MNSRKMITAQKLADTIGVSRTQIARLIKNNGLQSYVFAGVYYLYMTDVTAFFESEKCPKRTKEKYLAAKHILAKE